VSDYTEEQAKADAETLVARLEADPGFKDRVIADPHTVLGELGLPEDTIDELAQMLDGADVQGFGSPIGGVYQQRAADPGRNPTQPGLYNPGATTHVFGLMIPKSGLMACEE